ncbi:dihydropteroate synthase [Mycetocola reblochoni]|nr:dihydropteroate synthase [Mycetocola reblochoni]RLP69012.1 dihydropteroate synthase [Mycetocola reblochoni]
MAVLNTTPDSFSDGGRFAAIDDALAHARLLREQGADLIDVGGESTRPGADRVAPVEERRRTEPVVAALAAEGAAVSIDTFNASTAAAAIEAGAVIVNDVSGGLADPAMLGTVAASEADYVLGHWRGHADRMAQRAHYADAAVEVRDELARRRDVAVAAGIAPERIVLDPGLGFAKTAEHNWRVLARLDLLTALGHRVLVGASRKRFVAELLPEGSEAMAARDAPSALVHALAAQAGAWGVRAHSVPDSVVALRALRAWQSGSRGGQ